ncbi:hypothetical protein [Rheinheimera texasensis]|uniref:hypothetical protein n=1 Tax=Rheinheimera texasensis TaxID=306205 RepID=UPI0032B23999
MTSTDVQQLQQKAEQILQSGIFAGSARLHSLFQYLLRCSLAGYTPKEFEVAVDGMGQNADFDVTQDSLVRVHIHKLRRKLAEVQAQQQSEHLLVLPRGEYRFLLLPATAAAGESPTATAGQANLKAEPTAVSQVVPLRPSGNWLQVPQRLLKLPNIVWLLLPWVLLVSVLSLQWFSQRETARPATALDQLLQPFAGQQAPVLLVLGDYYLFAEADAQGQVQRLVRQFDINSPLQLLQSQQTEPALAAVQFDLGLSYLPTSVAAALGRLAAALERQQIRYDIVLASAVSTSQLQHQGVIYLGQLSGLGALQTEWQQAAQLQPYGSFDELQDQTTGQLYRNATPLTPPDTLPEYGYLHRFTAQQQPRLILAGLRDDGLSALSSQLQQTAQLPATEQEPADNTQEWLFDSRTQQWLNPGDAPHK